MIRQTPLTIDAYMEEVLRRKAAQIEADLLHHIRYGGGPFSRGYVEVITDPGDLRGYDARPVRRAA